MWKADTAMAHIAFFFFFCDCVVPSYRPWVLAFPIAVALLWLAEETSKHAERLHAILHVVTVAGMHCYLYPSAAV
jgi:hypothetical protein